MSSELFDKIIKEIRPRRLKKARELNKLCTPKETAIRNKAKRTFWAESWK